MDLNYSAEELAFRDEVRAWLVAILPAEVRDKIESYAHLSKDDLLSWHRILAKKGWVAPARSKEWGGTGWNVVQRYIFEEELGYAGAPPIIPFGVTMCAAGLLRFGSEAQKKRFLHASTTATISGAKATRSPAPAAIWPPLKQKRCA